jgi:lipid-binding SYLF domain-containing protein
MDTFKRAYGNLTTAAVILGLVFLGGSLQPAEAQQSGRTYEESLQAGSDTVQKAAFMMKGFLDQGNIPHSVFRDAAAVAIVPNLIKAGFIAGGHYGNGVLLTHENNRWSAPVFISISGASIGAQIGVTSTDVLLVFNERNDIRKLMEGGDFMLGFDAIVAAGPAGAGGEASGADIYAYRHSKGLFAGISLNGGVMSIDQDATSVYYASATGGENARGYYGSDKSGLARDLLEMKGKERAGHIPSRAENLRDLMQQATG